MPRHRVQRHGEGVTDHGHFIAQVVRDGDEHRLVGRQVVGEAAGSILRRAGVDACRDGALGEVPTQAVVAVLTGRAGWVDAPRATGEPGVQDDTLAHLEGRHRRTDLDDIGHHLVAEDSREGEEPVQRAIVAEVVAEVHEDHLGVGAADAGQARLGDAPVVAQQLRPLQLLEPHRRPGQPAHQAVGLVRWGPAVTADAIEQTLHSYVPPPRRCCVD